MSQTMLRIQCPVCRFIAFVLCVVLISKNLLADRPSVRLRLKNGDFISGQLGSAETSGHVSIRCSELEEPLEYDIQAIGSLEKIDGTIPSTDDKWSFSFANGSVIVGNLRALTAEEVTIDSAILGRLTLPRVLLTEIANMTQVGRSVFIGPRPGQGWKSETGKEDWIFEGGALTTSSVGKPVECDVQLPGKCEIHLVLSWSQTPNFVMLLGSMLAKPNAILHATGRIEVWDDMLVLVREVDSKVDLVPIGRISEMNGRKSLVIYMDQANGDIAVSSPQDGFIGKLQVKTFNPQVNSKVQLMNFSKLDGAIRLERLEVREWDGRVPNDETALASGIVGENGKRIAGEIVSYDAKLDTLSFNKVDKSNWNAPLSSVRRAFFANKQAALTPKPEAVHLNLSDNTKIVGIWKNTTSDKAEIQIDGMTDSISIGLDHIASATGNAKKFNGSDSEGRIGSLETESMRLKGSLSGSSGPGELKWRAQGTASESKLHSRFVGKIVYAKRAETPAAVNSTAVQAGILFLGGRRDRTNSAKRAASAPDFKTMDPGLKFRSGDEVKGKVERIDEQGVTFAIFDQTKFVPHSKMEHVTLLNRQQVSNASAATLKRLMTIPRASKDDPPTHLFVSVNGDYLRGRLVKLEAGRVTAEIRLANVEFAVDSIAQIYWLHSRDWEETKIGEAVAEKAEGKDEGKAENTAALPAKLQVHVISVTGKAVTFTPTSVAKQFSDGREDQLLKGENELLGECQVLASDVATVLIGRDVGSQARDLQKDAWKLSVATLPKVFQESEKSGEGGSDLIGKPAPDFSLPTTAGGKMKLSDLRGRVLVLDFWASWCGPCMKTMPEVERIVQDIGGDQVELIAVNLQESKEKAMAAIKRLELNATVALDADGNVAQMYQASAIPQTVIIDRQGKITHLFIGGGARFLEQFKQALSKSLNP